MCNYLTHCHCQFTLAADQANFVSTENVPQNFKQLLRRFINPRFQLSHRKKCQKYFKVKLKSKIKNFHRISRFRLFWAVAIVSSIACTSILLKSFIDEYARNSIIKTSDNAAMEVTEVIILIICWIDSANQSETCPPCLDSISSIHLLLTLGHGCPWNVA